MRLMLPIVAVALAFVPAARASLFAIDLGTAPPPSALGGNVLFPLFPDDRPIFEDVGGIGTPFGPIGFSPALNHRVIGSGWTTWSHGYTGDVYYTNGATSVTITLPADIPAFVFYAEPNPFAVFTITAIADGAASLGVPVGGDGGANGFGFYGTGLTTIASIVINCDTDFAIGELWYSPPIPNAGSLGLCGVAGMALSRRRR